MGFASRSKETSAPEGRGNGRGDYERHLEVLQLQLTELARWLTHTSGRLAVVIEGRDTAGKGGVIAAISQRLNPRQCHVVALD
ncbi:MAG TPA: polyphosphate kinase 2, partial [Burkholderiaceae bacterium]